MPRAWQTPHGARPNREEVWDFGSRHVPARCVKPPGRSLEPRSNAGPRGMIVLREQSRRQNSAYRSGCHKSFIFSAILPLLSLVSLLVGVPNLGVEWMGHSVNDRTRVSA